MGKIHTALAACLLGLLAGCATNAIDSKSETTVEKFQLKVALYPYIPEKEKFAAWIKGMFEDKHPDIELVVRAMNADDLAYDYDKASAALKDDTHTDHQHLIEIDSVILGKLVEADAVTPFQMESADFFPFAQSAVTIEEIVYGIPHWTCGNFIITPYASVAAAESATQLLDALEALGTPAQDLGGDLKGSYGSPVAYLDALIDSTPNADIGAALKATTIEPSVRDALKLIGDACGDGTTSYCGGDQIELFAEGKLDAMVSYSERLNLVLASEHNRAQPRELLISPAPLGNGRNAFLFTDALVLSPTCSSQQCQSAAKAFAEFYVSDAVFAASVMSHDDPGAPPRYLLPSTRSVMNTPALKYDPIYSQIAPFMEGATPFPNQGLPEAVESELIRNRVDPIIQSGK